MKKVIIAAAAAALFACAVQANENVAPAKQMTAEECKTAMGQCEKDNKDAAAVAACKEKLRNENGCK